VTRRDGGSKASSSVGATGLQICRARGHISVYITKTLLPEGSGQQRKHEPTSRLPLTHPTRTLPPKHARLLPLDRVADRDVQRRWVGTAGAPSARNTCVEQDRDNDLMLVGWL